MALRHQLDPEDQPVAAPRDVSGRLTSGTWLEAGFCVLALLFFAAPLFELIRRPGGQEVVAVDRVAAYGLIQAGILAISAALAVTVRKQMLASVRTEPMPWILLGLASLSVFWSTDPGITLKGAVLLTGAMIFAAYFGVRFSPTQQAYVLATALSVAIVMSLVTIAWFPAFGIDVGVHQGAWRGAFIHKNAFGRLMALAGSVGALLAIAGTGGARYAGVALAAISTAMVYMSRSRTSAAVLLAMCVSILVIRSWRIRVSKLAIWVALLGLIGLYAWLAWSQRLTLVSASGTDDTLAGRALLWLVVLLKVFQHPIVGFGFRAFWEGNSGDYLVVWRSVGWSPPHAHNGLLDVTLDLGVVGLVVLLAMFVRTLAAGLVKSELGGNRLDGTWAVFLMLFTILTNATESSLLRTNIFWILAVAAAVGHSWPPRRSPTYDLGNSMDRRFDSQAAL